MDKDLVKVFIDIFASDELKSPTIFKIAAGNYERYKKEILCMRQQFGNYLYFLYTQKRRLFSTAFFGQPYQTDLSGLIWFLISKSI